MLCRGALRTILWTNDTIERRGRELGGRKIFFSSFGLNRKIIATHWVSAKFAICVNGVDQSDHNQFCGRMKRTSPISQKHEFAWAMRWAKCGPLATGLTAGPAAFSTNVIFRLKAIAASATVTFICCLSHHRSNPPRWPCRGEWTPRGRNNIWKAGRLFWQTARMRSRP